MIVEVMLGHFFRRALEMGCNLQFVEFRMFCSLYNLERECRMFFTSSWREIIKNIANQTIFSLRLLNVGGMLVKE